MKSSIASLASSAIVLLTSTCVLAGGNYDCGTEQAAIRQRANELAADVDARKVNIQNSCAYLEAAAQQAERQAAFLLNCYQGLKLTQQQAAAKALLLGASGHNMRERCPLKK